MNGVYIGIDTSNYTTSAAVVDNSGKVLVNCKIPLPVTHGERGLRQSDAVFHHTKNMPQLIERIKAFLASVREDFSICAVGYSSAPRDVEGSYMPCFLVGESVANSIALGVGAPVYSFSHQAGHIMAALYSSDSLEMIGRRFAAFHISGGTTELVLVTPDDNKVFSIEKIGGTLDMSAGQLVDRIGVRMGYDFPAGKYVDELAITFEGEKDNVRISCKDLYCNFSGAENKALELYEKTGDPAHTASYVLDFISRSVLCMSERLRERYPDIPIVFSGGVMSSSFIKQRIRLSDSYFASPEFSSDNAAGCALLTRYKHQRS